jgi:hypothetical protein
MPGRTLIFQRYRFLGHISHIYKHPVLTSFHIYKQPILSYFHIHKHTVVSSSHVHKHHLVGSSHIKKLPVLCSFRIHKHPVLCSFYIHKHPVLSSFPKASTSPFYSRGSGFKSRTRDEESWVGPCSASVCRYIPAQHPRLGPAHFLPHPSLSNHPVLPLYTCWTTDSVAYKPHGRCSGNAVHSSNPDQRVTLQACGGENIGLVKQCCCSSLYTPASLQCPRPPLSVNILNVTTSSPFHFLKRPMNSAEIGGEILANICLWVAAMLVSSRPALLETN